MVAGTRVVALWVVIKSQILDSIEEGGGRDIGQNLLL